MIISWTPTARKTYFAILDYLEKSWGEKDIRNFISEVNTLLNQIANNPEMFPSSKKMKNVRKGLISKHNSLYYRINPSKKELELLTFWDNRQDPRKLDY
jgi:plasmid stabilization system protein ParE